VQQLQSVQVNGVPVGLLGKPKKKAVKKPKRKEGEGAMPQAFQIQPIHLQPGNLQQYQQLQQQQLRQLQQLQPHHLPLQQQQFQHQYLYFVFFYPYVNDISNTSSSYSRYNMRLLSHCKRALIKGNLKTNKPTGLWLLLIHNTTT
jgi:hypothetical protein